MTKYEHFMNMRDQFNMLANQTTGYMQSVWLRNAKTVEDLANSFTVNEAQETVNKTVNKEN